MGESRGTTIFELLAVMSVTALLSTIVVSNLKVLNTPASTGAAALVGFCKEARAKAMASTLAYTVKPASSTSIITTYAKTCATTPQTNDTALKLTLPRGARLSITNWSFCYSTRGLADSSLDIVMGDTGGTKTVQVGLGGGVRIKP